MIIVLYSIFRPWHVRGISHQWVTTLLSSLRTKNKHNTRTSTSNILLRCRPAWHHELSQLHRCWSVAPFESRHRWIDHQMSEWKQINQVVFHFRAFSFLQQEFHMHKPRRDQFPRSYQPCDEAHKSRRRASTWSQRRAVQSQSSDWGRQWKSQPYRIGHIPLAGTRW